MTHKKNAESNEELKHKKRADTEANTVVDPVNVADPSGSTGPASPESTPATAVTCESVKAEMMDRILRLQADFDNYRRRTRKEQSELGAFVTPNLIKELLP